MVRLVPIEKHPIPMVLLVHMHLIKGTYIIFPCDLVGYRAIPMVHWYQWYDWYQWKSTLFQWFYWWICISLRGLRLFSHVTWLGTGQFRWSIGTNGAIGTNGKWCHSNGSIGAKQVHFYTKWKRANNYYERSSFYKKTTQNKFAFTSSKSAL